MAKPLGHCQRSRPQRLASTHQPIAGCFATGPAALRGPGLDGLGVHPLRCLGIPLDLEVLRELFLTDDATLGQEGFDLAEDERVPLDRRGVVGLLVPDVPPDPLRLSRAGEAAQVRPQVFDGVLEPAVVPSELDQQRSRPAEGRPWAWP